jgi:hypothetical protein
MNRRDNAGGCAMKRKGGGEAPSRIPPQPSGGRFGPEISAPTIPSSMFGTYPKRT